MATAVAHASTIIKKVKGPDLLLVKDQLALLQYAYNDWGVENFAKYFLWILAKREDKRAVKKSLSSRYVPFEFNPIQSDISRNIAQKNICLKPRQVGLTTWFLIIRCLLPTLLAPGTNGFLISQNNEMAQKHFTMLKRAFKFVGAVDPSGNPEVNDLNTALLQNLFHTRASNRKELIFDQLDNFVGVGSAEVLEVGQGLTLHRVVCSEVARWPGDPEETLANLKEAIVFEGTLDLESTADGAHGYFYQEYLRASNGSSDFRAHFHPWWYEPTYKVELNDKQQEEMRNDLNADELRLMEKVKITLQQVAFRRAKQLSLRHNFEEKYPEDPISCFLLSGKGFFDKDILKARMIELQSYKPWAVNRGGEVVIFKQPIRGRNYVIGADPASGKTVNSDDTDFSSAKVIDEATGEDMASYRARLAPQEFAMDLAELGRYYNNAVIAVERGTAADAGGEGGSVIITLKHDCGYGNVYVHKEWMKREKSVKKEFLQEGLPMNGRTRPIALNKLRYFIENEPDKVYDLRLIEQCLQFVRNEVGRPAAAEGSHDDDVLASAIAHIVRSIRLGWVDPLAWKRERYGDTPQEFQEEEEVYAS